MHLLLSVDDLTNRGVEIIDSRYHSRSVAATACVLVKRGECLFELASSVHARSMRAFELHYLGCFLLKLGLKFRSLSRLARLRFLVEGLNCSGFH